VSSWLISPQSGESRRDHQGCGRISSVESFVISQLDLLRSLARGLHSLHQDQLAPKPGVNGDAVMRMNERYRGSNERAGVERIASDALGYLRSRRSEHWLMFLAGLVIGLTLG
jgi:hypothetical protein